MNQSILFGDATEITVLLRDTLSDDDQQALDERKKNRHQERIEAKLTSCRGESHRCHER